MLYHKYRQKYSSLYLCFVVPILFYADLGLFILKIKLDYETKYQNLNQSHSNALPLVSDEESWFYTM